MTAVSQAEARDVAPAADGEESRPAFAFLAPEHAGGTLLEEKQRQNLAART